MGLLCRGAVHCTQLDCSGTTKPGLGPAAELLFGIAQKVTKKLAPNPAVPCGARNGQDQNKSADGALPRAVGSWFWSTTARCSAPRRGATGR